MVKNLLILLHGNIQWAVQRHLFNTLQAFLHFRGISILLGNVVRQRRQGCIELFIRHVVLIVSIEETLGLRGLHQRIQYIDLFLQSGFLNRVSFGLECWRHHVVKVVQQITHTVSSIDFQGTALSRRHIFIVFQHIADSMKLLRIVHPGLSQ